MNSRIPEVDQNLCVGCGFCAEAAPNTFALDREKLALVLNPGGDPEEAVARAIAECPVAAISWQE
ncbi:MAG: ferredoxin [Desulfobacteraceae bacterium]|nr:ferredoxin [Desulfobacteraceae bacterium]